jgi:hypothetical protein
MKIILTESQSEKIYEGFKKIMSQYSNLHEIERNYDFWDYKKNSYVDYSPLNYYDNIDDETWDDDDWVFQYAPGEPYTYNINENYPLLQYVRTRLSNVKKLFGPYFDSLLIRWFKETYNRDVRRVVDDHEGYEILGIYN